MKDLTVTKNEVIQPVDMQVITEYLDSTGLTKQLLPKEKAMFVNMAKDYGLNPFKREIYCTVYGQGDYRQCSIVTGYEVYLKRAERIGKLNGWQCDISGSIRDGTLAATVTIHRKDWQHEFKHTAYYVECVQCSKKTGEPNAIWKKMPIFMTKKVAIAQAFRLCFSDEFGGMPYTNDELGVEPVKETEMRNVTPEAPEPTSIEPNSGEPVMNTEDIAISDNRMLLADILYKYEKQIDPKARAMCQSALNGDDENDISDKLNRVIAYLGRKGIEVNNG